MYQENNHRAWQSSVSNPPTENLHTFLQKRIKAIISKEWWDFIVNVNTLNSHHASLLYSVANLCPSFNSFLQSKDKEWQVIVKKRPMVKPRIFSGSERIVSTPDLTVPKQLPLVTRRNSATELVKILNELYPNKNTTKCKQLKPYGPSSKQRKSSQIPNKKHLSMNTNVDSTKKNNLSNERFHQLSKILDGSQNKNAHSTNVKKSTQSQLSMPVLVGDSDGVCKTILSNVNYDLNQNSLNQGPKKIKKIIKVKKKRYVYSSAVTGSKKRLKYILEDETPNLSLKLIKKYRIKKCSIELTRLKDSVLNYYAELRFKSLNLEPNKETQLTILSADGECKNYSMNAYKYNCPQSFPLSSEKQKNVTQKSCNENALTVKKFNTKELKNMYCHGEIVPVEKGIVSGKINDFRIKHFVSFKEKKVNEIIGDTIDTILQPKENTKMEEVTEKTYSDSSPLVSEVLEITDSITNKTQFDTAMESEEPKRCNDKSIHNFNNQPINMEEESKTCELLPYIYEKNCKKEELKNPKLSSKYNNDGMEIDNNEVDIDNSFSERTYSDNITKSTANKASKQYGTIYDKSVGSVSMTGLNGTPACRRDNSTVVNEAKETVLSKKLEEIEIKKILSVVDKSGNTNNRTEIIDNISLESFEKKTMNLNESSPALLNGNKVLEPLNKRPRLEVNLAEMKLEITKTLVKSENNDLQFCKICQLSFDSLETWNKHFENNVPKCTPNLQVTCDNPRLPSLNFNYTPNLSVIEG